MQCDTGGHEPRPPFVLVMNRGGFVWTCRVLRVSRGTSRAFEFMKGLSSWKFRLSCFTCFLNRSGQRAVTLISKAHALKFQAARTKTSPDNNGQTLL